MKLDSIAGQELIERQRYVGSAGRRRTAERVWIVIVSPKQRSR